MRLRALVACARTAEDAPLLAYARGLADAGLLRELTFVHVPPDEGPAAPEALAALEADVEQHFGPAGERMLVRCQLVEGPRLDALLDSAQQTHSDVILLGHRRARSGQRSLARRLAMIAPCSVWLAPEGGLPSVRRILAPVDFSEHSADSLATALDVARAVRAESCLALHVVFDESLDRSPQHKARYAQRQVAEFDRFLSGVDTAGVAFDFFCDESARPAQAILRVAQQRESDLIVMSTRGRSRAAAILLGSVTSEVIIGTQVPLLAVKHYGAKMNLFQALKDGGIWNRANLKTN